jgi:hypothetical protein
MASREVSLKLGDDILNYRTLGFAGAAAVESFKSAPMLEAVGGATILEVSSDSTMCPPGCSIYLKT